MLPTLKAEVKRYYLESHVAQNNAKVAHNPLKVAHNYRPLAFQVHTLKPEAYNKSLLRGRKICRHFLLWLLPLGFIGCIDNALCCPRHISSNTYFGHFHGYFGVKGI